MSGPPPMPAHLRRRRNTPAGGEWVQLPTKPFDGEVPEVDLVSDLAKECWASWWSSPMAHMWSPGDYPGLVRLIRLVDSPQSVATVREVRLQEDRFGLSPKGRQNLRWYIPEDESPGEGAGVTDLAEFKRRLAEGIPLYSERLG